MSTLVHPTQFPTDSTTIAKVAASRAEAWRAQAASLVGTAMTPLRKALLVRAAELDLAASVLLDPQTEAPPATNDRHLCAIA